MTGRNRLADATSPYLLQHADNPVAWWPWSDAAFAEAARRDVPVLLSVGYAACHWCHVMAHESFEDAATASEINASFVAVKVDREERPDVDAVYMQATQAMTGQGGWPMTVFLTPDRRPFYAGTYFPPSPRHGMPAFRQVLAAVAEAWRDRRDEVLAGAESIVAELAELSPARSAGDGSAVDVGAALAALGREFDRTHGGFGRSPKFPPSMVLEALLREGSSASLELAGRTLTAMACGGIHDQLRGGFARYSVDARWEVPHFEKMLYDNGLLLGDYVHWWRRTGEPLARDVVLALVGWLVDEMQTAEGAFAASLDADSLDAEGRMAEGAFYAWSPAELTAALGPEDGRWAAAIYGVSEAGTFEHGRSTLRRTSAHPEAGATGEPAERAQSIRSRLLAVRSERSRPGRDDKVVAAWNGWTIDALVVAALVLDRPDWLDVARRAADAVWRVHWVDGRLRRTSRDGRVGSAPAILEDYGALIQAFIRLACATTDPRWIDRAEQLAQVVLTRFDDGAGGFYDTADDAERLFARPQDPTDNATPSGLSSVVHGLRLLGELTGEDRFGVRADTAAATAAALATRAPRFAGWLLADAISRDPARAPVQVAIVGTAHDPARAALLGAAWRTAPAGSAIVAGEGEDPGFALLRDRGAQGGAPTAYVCRHFVCRLPVTTVEALTVQLSAG